MGYENSPLRAGALSSDTVVLVIQHAEG